MADHEESLPVGPAISQASLLPIARYRRQILYSVEKFPVSIVIGATGSGKTTQMPQFLEEAGWCKAGKQIAITQPRRVAATSVATRVAQEFGCAVGEEVGYLIRFEDFTSARTKIKFMTDGMLLREILVDPLLTKYSVIIVDEAHERSLSSDILLSLLKKIRRKRPDMRIIVSSATLQAKEIEGFFNRSSKPKEKEEHITNILNLPGRMHPVDIHYLEKPAEDYIELAVQTVFEIHSQEGDGDILIFVTGREEIDGTLQLIADRSLQLSNQSHRITALPLYAGLPKDEQMLIFQPAPQGHRKVIVATNIAEASVTIDGIVFVIDCGFVKLRAFNPKTGIETLVTVPVSKASANQRAGRAGRTKPGKCYRLWAKAAHSKLPESTVPEIQRANFAPIVLQLKALGIDNVVRFDYFSNPPAELLLRALDVLYSLGALDDGARLTKIGEQMAELGIEPMMAKALLTARQFGCESEMLTIAAMTSLQGGSVWFQHEGEKKAFEHSRWEFAAKEGDHLTFLNAYHAFVAKGKKAPKWCSDNHLNYKTMCTAENTRNQLRRYLERFGVNVQEMNNREVPDGPAVGERIRRCLTTGFFAHAAKMQADGTFRTVDGGTILHAHPSSLMFNRKADWVIFNEILETSAKTYIRDVSMIEKKWLLEYAPEFYRVQK